LAPVLIPILYRVHQEGTEVGYQECLRLKKPKIGVDKIRIYAFPDVRELTFKKLNFQTYYRRKK